MIHLSDIHVSLQGNAGLVNILHGITLDVEAGACVGLVGPSGSGKSTLLMIIAGLERTSRGSVLIDGTDITHFNEDRLARFRGRNIGIVFQSFHLIPTLTALENVAIPLDFAGVPKAYELAADQLERVGLAERRRHYPGEMSGGEQQRVALARALAGGARLILADEPTGNLDKATGGQIADLLFALPEEQGTTLLLVTHDETLARRCDRIVHLEDGRIVS